MIKALSNTNFNEVLMRAMNARGWFPAPAANKSVEDTEYHQAFTVNGNSLGYTFGDDDRPERITKAFFASTSAYLSKVKVPKADEAVALVLTDVSGVFKFAAIVEYHENENDANEPGNWSYVMTLNEDDLADLEKTKVVKKLLYNGQDFKHVFDKVGYDIACIEFQHESYMFDACILVIDTLVQILDREAKDGEIVDIEMTGYFTASVSVEGGEKVFAITPDGHQKEIIKDDSVLEK